MWVEAVIGFAVISALLLGVVFGYGVGCLETEHWYRAHGWKA